MIRIGTRKSPLAQAQTNRVLAALPAGAAAKVLIESSGDLDRVSPLRRMERPGAFTHALTDAILDGRIDAAVHSLKDLPLEAPEAAPIVAVLARDDPADILLVRQDCEEPSRPLGIKAGARVGTSAPRRHSQLLDADPDLVPVDVRGNIGTRIHLLEAGVVDALLMAAAALQRLKMRLPAGIGAHRLDPTRFPGCPGQGAIAVQARRDTPAAHLLAALDDTATRQAVEAERGLLAKLGGGCGLPLGAYVVVGAVPHLHATFGNRDGRGGLARWNGDALSERELDNAANALSRPAPPTATPIKQGEAPRIVLLTIDAARLASYRQTLAAAGWSAQPWRAIETIPTGNPMPADGAKAQWVAVTSPRSATYALQAANLNPGPLRFAAVGPATATEMRHLGLPVHIVSREGTGASLADAIASFPAEPSQVLIPQATEPAGGLAEGLRARGFTPIPWDVYTTKTADEPLPGEAHALVLTSPSAVQTLRARIGAQGPGLRLIAFGSTTAQAMRDAQLPIHAVCKRPTPSGVLEALP